VAKAAAQGRAALVVDADHRRTAGVVTVEELLDHGRVDGVDAVARFHASSLGPIGPIVWRDSDIAFRTRTRIDYQYCRSGIADIIVISHRHGRTRHDGQTYRFGSCAVSP
jgi:hypothetical protein